MKHLSKTLAAAGLTALLSSAAFAAQVERVRGTVDKADGSTLTIKTEDGKTETVDVAGAKFAWVSRPASTRSRTASSSAPPPRARTR